MVQPKLIFAVAVYLALVLFYSGVTAQKVAVTNTADADSYYDDYADIYGNQEVESIDSGSNSRYQHASSADDKKTSKNAYVEQKVPKTLFETMFGDKLYMWVKDDITGGVPSIFPAATKEILKKKTVVGIYFSASWCPPCRQFTPVLVKLYNAINKRRPGSFEIIWVSGDRTQDDFISYFEKMPWLAVTLEHIHSVTETLSPRFKVRGIPHLVLLDGQDGSIISMDAKRLVAEDSNGLKFPWKSPHSRLVKLLFPKSLRAYIQKSIDVMKAKVLVMVNDLLSKLSPMQWFSKNKKKTIRKR